MRWCFSTQSMRHSAKRIRRTIASFWQIRPTFSVKWLTILTFLSSMSERARAISTSWLTNSKTRANYSGRISNPCYIIVWQTTVSVSLWEMWSRVSIVGATVTGARSTIWSMGSLKRKLPFRLWIRITAVRNKWWNLTMLFSKKPHALWRKSITRPPLLLTEATPRKTVHRPSLWLTKKWCRRCPKSIVGMAMWKWTTCFMQMMPRRILQRMRKMLLLPRKSLSVSRKWRWRSTDSERRWRNSWITVCNPEILPSWCVRTGRERKLRAIWRNIFLT